MAGVVERAIVAGAGMAGMWAAWALEQAELQVTVLEAGPRISGRNWAVRPGDTVPGTAGPSQRCTFSNGQCLNAGGLAHPALAPPCAPACRCWAWSAPVPA